MKRQTRRRLVKKRRSSRPARNRPLAPRTAAQFFAKSERFQDRWTRVTHAISKMRADDVSLHQASREFGLDPRTVVRLGRPALRKRVNGRYAVKASDRLLRVLVIPTRGGLREIAVRDSRQASQIAEYWNAVQTYLATGDAAALRKFRRKHIVDANRKRIPFLTDRRVLDRLGNAGVLSFESLYSRVR